MWRCYNNMHGAANLKIEEGCWLQALGTEQQGGEAQVWATGSTLVQGTYSVPLPSCWVGPLKTLRTASGYAAQPQPTATHGNGATSTTQLIGWSQQTQHRLDVLGCQLSPCKTLHTNRSCIQKTIALRHQKQRLLGTLLDSSASKRAAPNCTTHPKVSLYNSCLHIIEPSHAAVHAAYTSTPQHACLTAAPCHHLWPCERWHALHAPNTCMFMRHASRQLCHLTAGHLAKG